jgi:hypothetical protein
MSDTQAEAKTVVTSDKAEKAGEKKEEMKAEAGEVSFEDSLLVDSDSDSSDDEAAGLIDRIKEAFREQQTALIKTFIDYGPPYLRQEEHFGLINECSEPKQKIFTVHSILNAKADPNIRDPEDLYYAASHWACRNSHFMIVKMLHRAKADFNQLNEFGQSSLHMACIVKHPPHKAKTQQKMLIYLLEECMCDPNLRDKGGFCGLDYAAMNEDYNLIKILLKHGADVLRVNETLVASRKDLLSHINDPECYRILYNAIKKAETSYNEVKKERERIRKEKAHFERMQRRQEEQIQRKIREWKRKEEAAGKAYKEQKKSERDKRIRKEMHTLSNTGQAERLGGYTRNPKNGRWTWAEKIFKPTSTLIYNESREKMKELRDANKYEVFNRRWESVVQGEADPEGERKGEPKKLEMPWRMSTAFDLDTLSDDEKITDVDEEESIFDENDEELQDMDLDDVMGV